MKKHGQTQVSDGKISALENRVKELEILVKFYEEQLRLSKKRQLEPSSEKSEYDQLRLDHMEDSDAANLDEHHKSPDIELVKAHYRKKSSRQDRLPEDLPIEEILCELPEEEQFCPDCGNATHVMGKESREELVVIPAKVMIRRYLTCTYACRECAKLSDRVPIRKASAPAPVIKGSFASPESIAWAAHQKFTMGVPLYRQEQEWQRQGVLLSRQTMANWLISVVEQWLRPIVDEMKRRLLSCEVLHADETTFQVLREPGKSPRSKSYLWVYRTSGDADSPIVLAEYKPDRKTCNPSIFLADFSGYLHTDGYEVYHKLPSEIVVVGCWAHVRRKWDEALKVVPKANRKDSDAMRGKGYCDKLFEVERALSELDVDERHKKRAEQLEPLMDAFFAWASGVEARPKSSLGAAITYMFSQKKYLRNILLDGRLELSNNRVERTIKPFVISRKNFLFANTPRGAHAASVLFSLIETAKETGINPLVYLTYVFKTAPNMDMNDSENLSALLPSGYKSLMTRNVLLSCDTM